MTQSVHATCVQKYMLIAKLAPTSPDVYCYCTAPVKLFYIFNFIINNKKIQ